MAKDKKVDEAPAPETNTAAAPAAEAKETKSIVPAKYAGKYKGGGSDDVALFIKQECGEGDKFSFDSFWSLCRVNGIADEQVNKYQSQVADNAQGAKGRARMTLRNMLAAKARKNGKLLKQDGTEQAVDGGKVAVSGAAAKAQADAAQQTGDAAAPEQTGDNAAAEQTAY